MQGGQVRAWAGLLLHAAAAAVVAAETPEALPDVPQVLRVDESRSVAVFDVRALAFIPIQGTFTGLSGSVTRTMGEDSVDVVVPVAGLRMRSRSRRDWALSDEFFHAAEFPEIRFEAGLELDAMLAALDGGRAFDIDGALTLRGRTLPQSFQVTHSSCTFDAAATCDIELAASVSRKRFGMDAHSFTLADTVSMTIRLTLSRTSP